MNQKEASIYRSEHFHSAGSVHFLTGVDTEEVDKSERRLRQADDSGKEQDPPIS